MSIIRVLINKVRPNPDATLTTLLHAQDRVTLLVAVAEEREEWSEPILPVLAHFR